MRQNQRDDFFDSDIVFVKLKINKIDNEVQPLVESRTLVLGSSLFFKRKQKHGFKDNRDTFFNFKERILILGLF